VDEVIYPVVGEQTLRDLVPKPRHDLRYTSAS
jgi:hypothetical protein